MWTNSERGYGWLAIILHWIAVLVIITMITIGFRAEALGEAGDRDGRAAAMLWHISLGAIFALVLLARVLSSWMQKKPAPVEQPRLLQRLAGATHQVLLIAILIQVISGPLAIWSNARAIPIFDWTSIPSPFAARNEAVHELAEILHAIGRWTIIVFGTLHIAAVVKHAIDKQPVLQRMLAPPDA